MVLVFKTQTIIAGFIWAIVVAIGFALMADTLIEDMRETDPDDEMVNSETMAMLFKYGIPIFMLVFGTLLIGPLFGYVHQTITSQGTVLGVDSRTLYLGLVFAFSMLLNVAVFVTGTPFPLEKIVMNTWIFVSLGLIIALL